jgi:hypothetical protein
MIDTTDNNKIAEFINKYITIENHSYHQLNIFIDLFIGQYSKTNNKRIFYEGEEIATEKVIENFAKSDWFQDAMEESNRFYAEDIASEDDWEFGNRLVQECYEEGLITDEDFGVGEDGEPDHTNCLVDKEDLIERRADAMNEEDPIEWYRMNFGDDELNEVVKKNGLIDWDAAAEWSVNTDGIAHDLARYDGRENTQEYDGETYYIYRTN